MPRTRVYAKTQAWVAILSGFLARFSIPPTSRPSVILSVVNDDGNSTKVFFFRSGLSSLQHFSAVDHS